MHWMIIRLNYTRFAISDNWKEGLSGDRVEPMNSKDYLGVCCTVLTQCVTPSAPFSHLKFLGQSVICHLNISITEAVSIQKALRGCNPKAMWHLNRPDVQDAGINQ